MPYVQNYGNQAIDPSILKGKKSGELSETFLKTGRI